MGTRFVELDRESGLGVTGNPADQQTGLTRRDLNRQAYEFAAHRDERCLFQKCARIGDVRHETGSFSFESGAQALEVRDHAIGVAPF